MIPKYMYISNLKIHSLSPHQQENYRPYSSPIKVCFFSSSDAYNRAIFYKYWMWRWCCIAWGSRRKSHDSWDGEYEEIINEKCLNCTFFYLYQNNAYLQIYTWIWYTCMLFYSLSLGNLHHWFYRNTTWIYIIHKDIVHSKDKTSWETGAG